MTWLRDTYKEKYLKEYVEINAKIDTNHNLTTKEVFYIAKALKIKHEIKITESLKQTNFNEFYENINKNVLCDSKTLEHLLKIVNKLDESVSELIPNGKEIVSEEKSFRELNWSQIISNLKTKFEATNKRLGNLACCSYKSISEWERNARTPNYNNCKLLMEFISKNKLDAKKLSNLKGKKHTYKSRYINLEPLDLTPELAEFIGILNGDGSITKGGLIVVTGNHIEDFIHHRDRVNYLIKKLFNKDVRQKIGNSVISSSFTSLSISKQLESLNLPIGKKINLRIPNKVLDRDILLKNYLRGLFDTDGTICRRNKYNIRVGYGSFKVKKFTEDVLSALKKLKFNSIYITHHRRSRVEIIDDTEVIRFFKEIGSCNYSKIARFLYWRLNHNCPSYNYPEFSSKLKEMDLDIEKLGLPFLWSKEYIHSQNINIQKILMPKLEDDKIKIKMSNLRESIDWRNKISLLKRKFNLRILTQKFNCDYKTIWQWQTGRNLPNLNKCVGIVKFCKNNGIKLID